jgi:Protein of unknown function (DUF2917)
MNIELDNSTLSLARDGLVALRDAERTRVTCVSGTLWITEYDREGDVILEAGEVLTIGRPGLTLIMVLSPASLQFAERREGLATRIGGWLARMLPPGRPAAC